MVDSEQPLTAADESINYHLSTFNESGGAPWTCSTTRFRGSICLANSPGTLVRLTLQGEWPAWQDSHLQPSRFERDASANWATRGWLAEPTRPAEAECGGGSPERRLACQPVASGEGWPAKP